MGQLVSALIGAAGIGFVVRMVITKIKEVRGGCSGCGGACGTCPGYGKRSGGAPPCQ